MDEIRGFHGENVGYATDGSLPDGEAFARTYADRHPEWEGGKDHRSNRRRKG